MIKEMVHQILLQTYIPNDSLNLFLIFIIDKIAFINCYFKNINEINYFSAFLKILKMMIIMMAYIIY
jgi:hypothetical protein